MSAIGSYLGELRRRKPLTQEELAELATLSLRTIRNIEAGRHDTSLATINLLLGIVGGSWLHVARLMRSDDAAMGKRLATSWLRGEALSEEDHDFFDRLTPDDQARLLDLARRMQK